MGSMPTGEYTISSSDLLASFHFLVVSQMNVRRYHFVCGTLS